MLLNGLVEHPKGLVPDHWRNMRTSLSLVGASK